MVNNRQLGHFTRHLLCRSNILYPYNAVDWELLSRHSAHYALCFDNQVRIHGLCSKISDGGSNTNYLRIFYWFGVHYDTALFIQAGVMIVMQTLLLHIALRNRASVDTAPFAGASEKSSFSGVRRPYDFWQWRQEKPYWLFLAYYTGTLIVLQVLIGSSQLYVNSIGYAALAVEAVLPLPQILNNQRSRSCKGFRLSVLVNWLIGDVMKMSFFFLSHTTITWAFKLCGIFQFMCDMYLGVQYLQFGSG